MWIASSNHALSAMLGLSLGMGVLAGPATADGDCTFSITDINFGNIDPAVGGSTTGTFTANCSGESGDTFRVCPNIEYGTGGTASGNPRYLLDGAVQLQFNLFSNAAKTQIWGSYNWPYPYTPPTVDIPIGFSGLGSAVRTIYAEIPAGQSGVGTGTYQSVFSGNDVKIAWTDELEDSCAEVEYDGDPTSFTVSANVQATCTVMATTLDFGMVGSLSANVVTTNSIDVACTNGTSYQIGLTGGNAAATDPTQRKMSLGATDITYGIYRDAAYTQPWGDTLLTDTVSGTATGTTQSYTAYGRVPSQTTPPPGTYTDTIVVIVTY